MRRKNRQIKFTLDIPAAYQSEEDFLLALADRLDEAEWVIRVDDTPVSISRANLGDAEIEPEE